MIKRLADARLVATFFDQQNKIEMVDLVHDHPAARLQLLLEARRVEQDGQGLVGLY